MSEQPLKDFQYYADQAESILKRAFANGRPPMLAQQEALVAAAAVYARLAAAAPPPEAGQFELHQADCPCITNR